MMTPDQELDNTLREIYSQSSPTWSPARQRIERAFAHRDYRVAKEARQNAVKPEPVVTGEEVKRQVDLLRSDERKMYNEDIAAAMLECLHAKVEELTAALQYYADEHNSKAGPWRVNSDDFGNVARAALKTGEGICCDG